LRENLGLPKNSRHGKKRGGDLRMDLIHIIGEKERILNALKKLDKDHDQEKIAFLYHRLVKLDPYDIDSLCYLDEYYVKCGRWKELVSVLKRRLAITTDAATHIELMKRLAVLLHDRLGRTKEAFEIYCRLAKELPQDREIILKIEEILMETKRWNRLIDILNYHASAVEDKEFKIRILKKMALIATKYLKDEMKAIQILNKILELTPQHSQTLDKLLELYSKVGKWEDFTRIIALRIQYEKDPRVQRELCRRLARVLQRYFRDITGAIVMWKEVLAGGDDPEAKNALLDLFLTERRWDEFFEILDKLKDLEQRWAWISKLPQDQIGDEKICKILEGASDIQGKWFQLISIYEELIKRTPEKFDKTKLMQRIAWVYENHLKDLGKALDITIEAFNLDPEDLQIQEEIERLATISEQWLKLINVYEKVIQREEDPIERAEIYRRKGEIMSAHLNDLEGAIQAYQKALELNPADIEILKQIEELSLKTKDLNLFLWAYEQHVKELEHPASQIAQFLHQAEILIQRFEVLDLAFDIYTKAFKIDPFNENLTKAIRDLAITLENQNQNGFERLTKLYQAQVNASEYNSWLQVKLLNELAYIQQSVMKDSSLALKTLKEALKLLPDHTETLSRVEELAQDLQKWEELAELYQEVYQEIMDPEAAQNILHRLANVLDSKLGWIEEAAEIYLRILEFNPSDETIFKRLSQIYIELDRPEDLLVLYERKLQKGLEETQSQDLLFQIAEIWYKNLKNPYEAIEVYKKILEIAPNDRRANQALEKLYYELNLWRELKTLLLKERPYLSQKEKASCLAQAAEICAIHLEREAEAKELVAQALALDANNIQAKGLKQALESDFIKTLVKEDIEEDKEKLKLV
jgi:tetratricopeptide (TPR) repeat protein